MTVLAIAADLGLSHDPDAWVTQACTETEQRIPAALATRDYSLLMEIRAGAEATYNRAFREGYGQPVRLRAAKTIRRVERAIGLALRAGQNLGEIRIQGESRAEKPGPSDVLGVRSRTTARAYFAMTTGSDKDFEAALNAAERDGNLSRNSVSRYLGEDDNPDPDWIPESADRTTAAAVRRRELIKELAGSKHSSRQISDLIGTTAGRVREIAAEMGVEIRADQVVGRTRRADDTNRIVAEVATTLDGLTTAISLVDPAQLDPAQTQNWAASINASLRTLTRFARQIKETQ